jgi:hypothetical protein
VFLAIPCLTLHKLLKRQKFLLVFSNRVRGKMSEDNNILKRKIEYFLNNNTIVHISLKNSKFLNGKILELAGDMLIIDDDFLGATPVYFDEIRFLEPYKSREERM